MSPAHRTRGMRSKFEARVSDALGEGWEYEKHKLPYTLENNYVPDFVRPAQWAKDTSIGCRAVYLEAKGRFTSSDRRKMIAVKAKHPECDLRIVFMRDNFLFKGSKTSYTQWAEKHGFKSTVFPVLPFTAEEAQQLCAKSTSTQSSTKGTTGTRTQRRSTSRRRPFRRRSSVRAAGSTKSVTAATSSSTSSSSAKSSLRKTKP